MTTKTFASLCAAVLLSASVVSCGSKTSADTKEVASTEVKSGDYAGSCTKDTKISVFISDYKYQTKEKETIKYDAANFEVKQSTWRMLNDSTAELSLLNYTNDERAVGRTDKQVEIKAKFGGKKGNKIGKGTYGYMAYKTGLYSQVTINMLKGKVWFNGSDQGNVIIDYCDKDHVCGSFDLMVDKPDNPTIGTVKLSGNFKVENK